MLYRCARWRRRLQLCVGMLVGVGHVLGSEDVVLCDGGVSYGIMGRYFSVRDVPVSCGGDMELCGVDTVVPGAVL